MSSKNLPLASLPILLGRNGFFWLTVSLLASLSLGMVDYGLARFLQLLLRFLGLTSEETYLLGGGWNWQPSLWQLLLLFLGLGIFRGIAQFWAYQGNDCVYETINTRLRLFALHEILHSSSQKYISATDTNSRVGEVFPQTAWFFWYTAWVLSFGIECLVLLGAMLSLAWRESLLASLGLGLIGLLVLKINHRVRAVATQIPEEQKALVSGIERIARNWLLVRVLRTNKREYNHLVEKTLNYYNNFLRAKFLGNFGAVIPLILGIFLLVIIIFTNIRIWKTPGIKLVACLYLFGRFLNTFSRMGRGFGMMNSVFPYCKISLVYLAQIDAKEISAALLPIVSGKSTKTSISFPENFAQSPDSSRVVNETPSLQPPPNIELRKVSFSYLPNIPPVLRNISLAIKGGEQLGIIGRSGSGKSTLLGLILGVLQPSNGKVQIAGINAQEFLAQPLVQVGYVGAEPFLIEGSIKHNLDYGSRKPYSIEEYRQALAAASLLEVVDRLPDGLDYRLTDNSQGLSAGQKQRLALARALLSKPQILVLDEVSANLDDETEAEIAKELLALKGLCTVIIVSHRPGILKFADTILELSTLQKSINTQKC